MNLEIAKDELKEIAKNAASRMMLEIFDGAIQNPNFINGIRQTPSNGFDKKTIDMGDINAMVDIAKQLRGKNTDYLSL